MIVKAGKTPEEWGTRGIGDKDATKAAKCIGKLSIAQNDLPHSEQFR